MVVKVGRALNKYDDAFNLLETLVTTYKQTGPSRHIVKLNGWRKCKYFSACTIVPEVQQHQTGDCFGSNTNCLGGQAYGTIFALGSVPTWGSTSQMSRAIIWSKYNTDQTRVTNVALYAQSRAEETFLAPEYLYNRVQLMEIAVVTHVETLDAFALPIRMPAGTAQALGWGQIAQRTPLLNRDPNEQYQRGYGTTLDVRNRSSENLNPAETPWPDTMVVMAPSNAPPYFAPPGSVAPHSPSRPRKGTIEKKLIGQASGALKTVLNIVTESKDVVDALFKALPPKYRERGASPQRKAAILWKHRDKIDPAVAIRELIKNQAEDAVYGRLGRGVANANRNVHRQTGVRVQFGLGPAL